MIPSNIAWTHLARLLAGCALVMQLVACNHIEEEEEEPIVEPVGVAHYFLDNRTDRSLTIEWTLSPALGSETHQTDPVAAGDFFLFATDAIIGVNPRPHNTFASLRLLDEAGNLVYRQDPIDDSPWDVVQMDDEEYGTSHITLTVTNASLSPGSAGARN